MSIQTINKISVLMVDDHPTLRVGIRVILEKAPDFCVVGEAANEVEARKLLKVLRPNILLLDLVMPNFSPSAFERWVRKEFPDTITVVLTAHDRDAYLASMIDAGVVGYLDKDIQPERLIDSIRRAAHGEILLDEQQISRAGPWHEDVEKKWRSLSERECQILCLLSDGASNKDIASRLQICVKTVEKYLERIYQKIEVNSRAKAVLWGLKNRGDFPY